MEDHIVKHVWSWLKLNNFSTKYFIFSPRSQGGLNPSALYCVQHLPFKLSMLNEDYQVRNSTLLSGVAHAQEKRTSSSNRKQLRRVPKNAREHPREERQSHLAWIPLGSLAWAMRVRGNGAWKAFGWWQFFSDHWSERERNYHHHRHQSSLFSMQVKATLSIFLRRETKRLARMCRQRRNRYRSYALHCIPK